jgi:hypothetical protein
MFSFIFIIFTLFSSFIILSLYDSFIVFADSVNNPIVFETINTLDMIKEGKTGKVFHLPDGSVLEYDRMSPEQRLR